MEISIIEISNRTIAFILIVVIISGIIFGAGLWVYGLKKAFQSHPITGVIVLAAEPLPLAIGISEVFFHYSLADEITKFHQTIVK